jgi:hypothetical protein
VARRAQVEGQKAVASWLAREADRVLGIKAASDRAVQRQEALEMKREDRRKATDSIKAKQAQRYARLST